MPGGCGPRAAHPALGLSCSPWTPVGLGGSHRAGRGALSAELSARLLLVLSLPL